MRIFQPLEKIAKTMSLSEGLYNGLIPRRSQRIAAFSTNKVGSPTSFVPAKKMKANKATTDAGEVETEDNSRKPLRKKAKKNANSEQSASIIATNDHDSRSMERNLWRKGIKYVAGVDEAGRGPLAGPVVAAAVYLPDDVSIEGIRDSKKLNEKTREFLFHEITSAPNVLYSISIVNSGRIDEINVHEATMEAMANCMQALVERFSMLNEKGFFLVDGNRLPRSFQDQSKAKAIVKGDSLSYAISAASILAKVTRDRIMLKYDEQWPKYGFKDHKGYGTVVHTRALLTHGPCDIHRRSFAPLKNWINHVVDK